MRRLAAKAFFPVGITITGFVALCCLILYSSLKADFAEQAAQEAESLATTIARSARHAMLTSDRETLAAIISNVGGQQGVATVRILNAKGLVSFSKERHELNNMPAKDASCLSCHNSAPARMRDHDRKIAKGHSGALYNVTIPILNERACSTAQCHAHSNSERVLGLLHVGVDRTPLQRTLAAMRTKMLIFSLLVLVLTVGGVAVLLNRTLLFPARRLAHLSSKESLRQIEQEFGKDKGEIGTIARNFLRVAKERDSCGKI